MKTLSKRSGKPHGTAAVAPAHMVRATLLVVAAGALIGWQRCLLQRSIRLIDGMMMFPASWCGIESFARTVEVVAGLWLAHATLLWLGLRAANSRLSWEHALAISGDGMIAVVVGTTLLAIAAELQLAPELAVETFWAGVLAWPLVTGVRLRHVSASPPRTITLVSIFAALGVFAPLLVTIARHPPW